MLQLLCPTAQIVVQRNLRVDYLPRKWLIVEWLEQKTLKAAVNGGQSVIKPCGLVDRVYFKLEFVHFFLDSPQYFRGIFLAVSVIIKVINLQRFVVDTMRCFSPMGIMENTE